MPGTVAEARNNFSRIAGQVSKSGREVVVFRHSKPWVKISPVGAGSDEAEFEDVMEAVIERASRTTNRATTSSASRRRAPKPRSAWTLVAEALYADGLFEKMAQVETRRVRDNILDATELLAVIPQMGSTNLPRSISQKYGADVRKLVVSPFLVLYKLLPGDRVLLLGVMRNRVACYFFHLMCSRWRETVVVGQFGS